MVSIKDVAREAGVSPQTVSNVINTPHVVSPKTTQIVKRTIDRLGYTPNASARRLRTKRSGTIAVGITPGKRTAVYDRFLHALAGEADKRSLRITLYKSDSQEDEITHYTKLCSGADVDAFVLTDTTVNDRRPDWLIKHRQTFVLFGRPWGAFDMQDPKVAWADVDGKKGIYAMTQHLILTGHRHIGFIGWPKGSGTGDDRAQGWQDGMLEAKLATAHELDTLRVDAQDDISAGNEACVQLLDIRPDIDAIVCVSDTLATGAIMASPDNLIITGFDNTETSRSLGFPSIDQNLPAITHEILRIIDEKLEEHNEPDSDGQPSDSAHLHMLMDPSLVLR